MKQASEREEFEQAAHYRDLIRTIERLSEKQSISSVGLEDQDFLAHYREARRISLQIFQMREGRIQSRREFHFEDVAADAPAFYAQVLAQYYASEESLPAEIYLPEEPADAELIERWLTRAQGSQGRAARAAARGEAGVPRRRRARTRGWRSSSASARSTCTA